ncbi:amino acid permease [Pseudogemmatithrix spongiicola]|uniref:Amino acid permease n=1 Tax=Pseudogemmatithrix spongiicola TaxID=3062599 RepID=A0AA49K1E8_9BACT|nr:amino acid permease [Gemmatimonadaceae bacterium 'strain 138']WKW15982.1 amino acid permease [Gemmatimonadaceae bacterium 'strain 318']
MANSTAPQQTPSPTLARSIGLWSAMAVVIGSTIGSGIFRSPAGIADKLPGPLPMLMAWVAGGIFAICGALTIAELASAIPKTGGIYVFLKEGWSDRTAFTFGWSQFAMIRASSLGGISITCAEYFFRVMGWDLGDPMPVRYTAAGAILLTAFFNIRGAKIGAAFTNFTVLAKYGGLLFIVIVAFAWGVPNNGVAHYTPMLPPGSLSISAFGLALVSTLWAFDGWADVSNNAGEIRDPQKNLPKALIGGTLLVMAIYLAANLAYLSVLTIDEMRVSRLVAADVAQRVIGPAGVVFVSVTVMISTFGTLNAVLFTSPRIFFAMAADGLFFKPVAAVHPTWGTPWVAIAMTATLGAIFVLTRSFEQLADAFVTAFLPFYFLAVASIFRLRKRADYQPTFRVPLYPVVPLLFMAAVLYLLANALIAESSRWQTAGVLGVCLVGIPMYHLTVGRKR